MCDLTLNGVWRPLLTGSNKCITPVSSPLIRHDRSAGGCIKQEVNNKVLYMDTTAEAWHKALQTSCMEINSL